MTQSPLSAKDVLTLQRCLMPAPLKIQRKGDDGWTSLERPETSGAAIKAYIERQDMPAEEKRCLAEAAEKITDSDLDAGPLALGGFIVMVDYAQQRKASAALASLIAEKAPNEGFLRELQTDLEHHSGAIAVYSASPDDFLYDGNADLLIHQMANDWFDGDETACADYCDRHPEIDAVLRAHVIEAINHHASRYGISDMAIESFQSAVVDRAADTLADNPALKALMPDSPTLTPN